MNIFVLHENPIAAAVMHCDKHVPKMVVEAAQMLASALRRHGATDEDMPLTKAGTPYKGGYAHHPCTVWAGDNRDNFTWLSFHALALSGEYKNRFGKTHACKVPIEQMVAMIDIIPEGEQTPFGRAFDKTNPDHDEWYDEDKYTAVEAYRLYYHTKRFANGPPRWEKGTPAPDWWQGVEVTA